MSMTRKCCNGPVPATRQGETETPSLVHCGALQALIDGFPYTPFEPSRFPIDDGYGGYGVKFVTFLHHVLVDSAVFEPSVLLHASFKGLLGLTNIAVTASGGTTLYLIHNVTLPVFVNFVFGVYESAPKGVRRLERD